MIKPVLDKVAAFDARYEHLFTFSYAGEIARVEAYFYNNSTGALVYGEGVSYTTRKTNFTLAAGALTNTVETSYYVKIRVYDSTGAAGPWSDPVVFGCYEVAAFYFKDIEEDVPNIVPAAYYEFPVVYEYDQTKNDLLNYYTVKLYDQNHNLISESGTYYNTDTPYSISNMSNEAVYYLQAEAYTQGGMEIKTALIQLNVLYTTSTSFSYIRVENIYSDAVIKITSQPSIADGIASWDDVEYTDNGGVIIPAGETVIFDGTYKIPENFVLSFIANPQLSDPVYVRLLGRNEEVEIGLLRRSFNEPSDTGREFSYAYLRCYNKQYDCISYYITSNEVIYGAALLSISVKRKGGLYSIALQRMGNSVLYIDGEGNLTSSHDMLIKDNLLTIEDADFIIKNGYLTT